MRPARPRPGFTLVEALLAFFVLTVLFALSLGVIVKVRAASHKVVCTNNLMQLGVAVHAYHNDQGRLPPYASGGEIYGSWFVHLLPYVDQFNLFQKIRTEIDLADSVLSTVNEDGIREQRFAMLMCPADPTESDFFENIGRTSYLANWYVLADGSNGPYSPSRRLLELTDGPANVVLFAEAYGVCANLPRVALFSEGYHNFGITPDAKPSDDPSYLPIEYTMFQTQPRSDACDSWRTQTPHPVMHVAMADGSVRALAADIRPHIWTQFLKPQDGLPMESE